MEQGAQAGHAVLIAPGELLDQRVKATTAQVAHGHRHSGMTQDENRVGVAYRQEQPVGADHELGRLQIHRPFGQGGPQIAERGGLDGRNRQGPRLAALGRGQHVGAGPEGELVGQPRRDELPESLGGHLWLVEAAQVAAGPGPGDRHSRRSGPFLAGLPVL